MRSICAFVAASSAACLIPAQSVPYGACIVSQTANVAPSQGLWQVTRAGTATRILGLAAAGSLGIGVSSLRMDPIDDRVWLGGSNSGGSTASQLNWIRVTGTTVSQFSQVVTIPFAPAAAINAIDFDDNGNLLVCGATGVTSGGVYRVARDGSAVGLVASIGTTELHNAMCRDAAGNLYVGMLGDGSVHVLVKNADGSFQAPVLLTTVPNVNIYGLTAVPGLGATPEDLWITSGDAAGTLDQIHRVPLTGGVPVLLPDTMTVCNWVEYDRRADDVLVCLPVGDSVRRIDRTTFVDTQVASFAGGVNVGTPNYIDANDDPDNAVRVLPSRLNGSVGPFTLELGTTAPPGRLAIIAVTQPTLLVLGAGITGVDGRFWLELPNLTLAGGPLAPGSLAFASASIDLASGGIAVGAPVAWPAN
jgi:hypothetical protein